jgi:hypothetical protein
MSEEFEVRRFSVFWPLLIFLAAFAFSCFYQTYQVVEQRSAINQRYEAEAVNLPNAKEAQNRLVALINDLVATSSKDPAAAQIVKEVKAAGILRDNPNATNSTEAPAAPATP